MNWVYRDPELEDINQILHKIIDENAKFGLDEEDKNIEKDKAPSWDDVGGLFEAKRKLKEIVDNSVKYSFLFKDNPKMLNSGILLYGPPGWGKILLYKLIFYQFNNLVKYTK